MRYVRNELSGEWWIDDGGSPMYADGDVGDMNHEMLVLESARPAALREFA